MKTTAEIRLANARQLASRFESRADFARELEMSDAYMWQILGDVPKRNIGNSIARRMEKACGMNEGWLDVPHDEAEVSTANRPEAQDALSADALRVARAFDNLASSAQKRAVINFLKAFTDPND
ncbi:hypothetical protein I5R65_07600 [Herbaspirillum sp. AP02]|uniref:hypothetical protein n=1 Tax=unclassified Herbaspirillum TaxID=2624150 RepID=UPI0015DB1927|nr:MULTISPECIES: hypothetical protein [unclassified Herbaspirillum]MBG7619324.1 hypothetical protein [Herbaspirillum sp. AP02]NZD66608.1 hypothetical protein [Herbaspirillum sp. AP21]